MSKRERSGSSSMSAAQAKLIKKRDKKRVRHTMRVQAGLAPSARQFARRGENRFKDCPYSATQSVIWLGTGRSNASADAGAGSGASPLGSGTVFFNVICLNADIAATNTNIGRIGRRFLNKAVALRGAVIATSSMDPQTQHVRMSLVWSRKPKTYAGLLPSYNDIFRSTNAVSLTSVTNAPDFKILRTWDFVTNDADSSGLARIPFDEYITLKNKETVLASGNADGIYSAMTEGALLLVAVSEGNLTVPVSAENQSMDNSSSAPGIALHYRVYFDE